MRFDNKVFFAGYRRQFGELKQYQVEGLNSLLANFEKYDGWWNEIAQIAHAFSEIKHESAHSFQPVVEGFYLGDSSRPGYFQGNSQRVINFQNSLRYSPHFGMGHIQLTWAENYKKHDALVRKYFPEIVQQYEMRTGEKFDLIAKPRQMLDADVSFAVMTIGMHRGTFRAGQTLDRHINSVEIDHFGAREIINGDKNYRIKGSNMKIGEKIAEDARRFEKILRDASIDGREEDVDLFEENDIDVGGQSGRPEPDVASLPAADLGAGVGEDKPQPEPNPADPGNVYVNEPDHDERRALNNVTEHQPPTDEERQSIFQSGMGRLNQYGDQFQGVNATLEKFGVANPLASTSWFSYIVMFGKFLFAAFMAFVAYVQNHPEYFGLVVLVLIAIAVYATLSRMRTHKEKQGVPEDVLRQFVALYGNTTVASGGK